MKIKSTSFNLSNPLLLLTRQKSLIINRVLLLLVLIFLSNVSALSFSGNREDPAKQSDEPKWVYDRTVNNVELYYMITECDGSKVVLLKFNNKNKHKVRITWDEEFETQYEKSRKGTLGKKQLILIKGVTSCSSCSDSKFKELLILPFHVNPTYLPDIKSFTFKNISVKSS